MPDVQIHLPISKEAKRALKELAKKEMRTMTSMARFILEKELLSTKG